MHRFTEILAASLAGVLLVAVPAVAQEDDWPSQPVTMIVPLAAGGGVDTMARIIAETMSEQLGERIIVENRGGGGGTIGASAVARADPDGYTFLFQSVSSAVVNPLVYTDLPYDPIGSFEAVTLATVFPLIMVTHPSVEAESIEELIQYAKDHPGELTYGSSGVGTVPHLAGEYFNSLAGVEIQHIPYRGNAPATTDLLAGRIHIMYDGVAPQLGNIRNGSVQPMGVTTRERSFALPDVPSISEVLSEYEVPFWTGVYAPAGTPQPILDKFAAATKAAVEDPETADRLRELGVDGVGSTPAEMDEFWNQQLDFFEQIVDGAGISLTFQQ